MLVSSSSISFSKIASFLETLLLPVLGFSKLIFECQLLPIIHRRKSWVIVNIPINQSIIKSARRPDISQKGEDCLVSLASRFFRNTFQTLVIEKGDWVHQTGSLSWGSIVLHCHFIVRRAVMQNGALIPLCCAQIMTHLTTSITRLLIMYSGASLTCKTNLNTIVA